MFNWFYKHFVKESRVLYVKDHRLAFWLLLGLLCQGVFGLFISHFRETTAISLAAPLWLVYLVYGTFTLGSILGLYGMCRNSKLEAAGLMLLSGALTAQFASAVHVYSFDILAASIVTLALAIGTFRKALQVATYLDRDEATLIRVNNGDAEELKAFVTELKNGQEE